MLCVVVASIFVLSACCSVARRPGRLRSVARWPGGSVWPDCSVAGSVAPGPIARAFDDVFGTIMTVELHCCEREAGGDHLSFWREVHAVWVCGCRCALLRVSEDDGTTRARMHVQPMCR